MEQEAKWNIFFRTGKIEDYLNYVLIRNRVENFEQKGYSAKKAK